MQHLRCRLQEKLPHAGQALCAETCGSAIQSIVEQAHLEGDKDSRSHLTFAEWGAAASDGEGIVTLIPMYHCKDKAWIADRQRLVGAVFNVSSGLHYNTVVYFFQQEQR
jgi:hypothetical protein